MKKLIVGALAVVGVFTILGMIHRIALLFQPLDEISRDLGIIFDHQYAHNRVRSALFESRQWYYRVRSDRARDNITKN